MRNLKRKIYAFRKSKAIKEVEKMSFIRSYEAASCKVNENLSRLFDSYPRGKNDPN